LTPVAVLRDAELQPATMAGSERCHDQEHPEAPIAAATLALTWRGVQFSAIGSLRPER
jgi:hypothetical protein